MDQNNYNEVHIERLDVDLQALQQIGLQMYSTTNEEQKKFIDTVLHAVENKNSVPNKCFYIDGPGGSGKTFTYKILYNILTSRNYKVATMAFTGIAATLLPNRKTVHKTFSLPVPLFSDSTCNITIESAEGQCLKNTDAFIWDEAQMAPRYALEIIDKLLRYLTQIDKPFGGKIMIIGGDFRQLLPVRPNSTRSEQIDLSIKFSQLWSYFEIHKLSRNMRALPAEIEFTQFLLNIGDGILNDINDNVAIPSNCIAAQDADIVEETYGKMIREEKFYSITKYAILSARNCDVNELNEKVIDLLNEETEKIYYGIDEAEKSNESLYESILPEHLNALNPTCLPNYQLRLRKYSIVMLIRNLSISEGLCNGTRLLVLVLGNHTLKCEILTGDKAGEIVFINRITLNCTNEYPFSFTRRQFPIKVAFAMTINKSQGQTFDKITIDLRRELFSHGQLYVALSRVRRWQDVKIYFGWEKNDNIVKNFVYIELLD